MSQLISPEDLAEINQRLIDKYGKHDKLPFFRVSWSEDQFEKRTVTHTSEGLALNYPEIRLIPKYKPLVHNKYILEGLTETPVDMGRTDIQGFKISYEMIWQFMDKNDNALPPRWDACYFILETLKENQEKAGKGVKYRDPNSDPKEALELQKQRLDKLCEELFGNETNVGDALAYKTGVVVPHKTTQGETIQ